MNKNFLSALVLVLGILISGGIIGFANAQTQSPLQSQEQKNLGDIQYPILELGSCANKESCKTYCDKPENVNACLDFAEKNNLMQKEEIDAAKNFQDNGMVGPGGCKGKDKCDTYCSDSTHIDECVAFAEKNGLMSSSELNEAKKVQAAIAKGIKPPACGGKKNCETYCSSSEHMEECMNFSIEAGIMDPQKQEESKKVLAAIKQGIKPPACKGKEECDAYCGTHMEECMTFSLAAGMVPDNQKEQMQKTLDAFKKGIKPPACQPNQSDQPGKSNQSGQGLQSCDQYCAESNHVEECVKFSVAIGNMTEEQGQNSIKNGNKGPGGCIGKDACDTFCNNPDNEETCFSFAKDNGMIPKEDLQKMEDGQQKMKDSFSSIPPEVLDCLTSTVGADVVEKMKTGSVVGRKFGDSINQCFQKSGVQERGPDQNQNNQSQQNQQGPNQQGQQGDKFQPGPGNVNPGGQQMPQQAGPGGCKGPEECKAYCESHQEECKNFQPQQNQGQPGQLFREKIEPNQPVQMKPSQGGPGNNGGNKGQSGWSNGTGNGGGHGGPNSQNGGPVGGPDDINQQNQPGPMQPQQPQIQPQPLE